MKTLISILILLSSAAQANSLSLSFGPSVDGSIGEKKALMLGYEFKWVVPSLKLEAGALNGPEGLTAFGGVNLGVHVVTEDGLVARIGFGPALFSQTNERLSSLGEFHIQAMFGLALKGWEAGAQFDHFSNAGFVPPNPGMDLVGLYVGVPL